MWYVVNWIWWVSRNVRQYYCSFNALISSFLVSIGGTTGLFVGASLLSFVEIIYYITIRPHYGKRLVRQQSHAQTVS